MSDPLIVTVAGVGAELSPEEQPALPVTPELLARDAEACEAAGASIYHLHVRDASGAPTMDVAAYEEGRSAVQGASDLIVQFSTGGAIGDPEEDRLRPLSLAPEMATLTTGTVNFGSDIFVNALPFIERCYEAMRTHGVLPEYEIFEAGMIATATRLHEARAEDHHQHFDFVLGVPGALPAWPDALGFLVSKLPEGATWSATGIGRAHLDVAAATINLGGHVRTGLEDVRFLGPGEPVRSNAQLIERVVDMARAAGRPVASPAQARSLLGLA
jgi:3-keto-5-aminohexanoate cleavage enzyme